MRMHDHSTRTAATLLQAAATGDRQAAEQLLPALYDELRRLAAHRLGRLGPGQTLQATALVHEAYLKLVGNEDVGWQGRGHFFGAAARAMRDILVDRARSKGRLKRGGDREREDLEESVVGTDGEEFNLVELDGALDALAEEEPRAAEVVMLRFFAGLDIEQAACALGVSVATANRDWRYAKAWLLAGAED